VDDGCFVRPRDCRPWQTLPARTGSSATAGKPKPGASTAGSGVVSAQPARTEKSTAFLPLGQGVARWRCGRMTFHDHAWLGSGPSLQRLEHGVGAVSAELDVELGPDGLVRQVAPGAHGHQKHGRLLVGRPLGDGHRVGHVLKRAAQVEGSCDYGAAPRSAVRQRPGHGLRRRRAEIRSGGDPRRTGATESRRQRAQRACQRLDPHVLPRVGCADHPPQDVALEVRGSQPDGGAGTRLRIAVAPFAEALGEAVRSEMRERRGLARNSARFLLENARAGTETTRKARRKTRIRKHFRGTVPPRPAQQRFSRTESTFRSSHPSPASRSIRTWPPGRARRSGRRLRRPAVERGDRPGVGQTR